MRTRHLIINVEQMFVNDIALTFFGSFGVAIIPESGVGDIHHKLIIYFVGLSHTLTSFFSEIAFQ